MIAWCPNVHIYSRFAATNILMLFLIAGISALTIPAVLALISALWDRKISFILIYGHVVCNPNIYVGN